jgi:transposase-like protein
LITHFQINEVIVVSAVEVKNHMQTIFLSNHTPEDYVERNGNGIYPDAPKKCPFKTCGIPIEMKKHGYYFRFLVTIAFTGRIRIRRYKCPKCGKTLSMLPSFCLSGLTYGIKLVVTMLLEALKSGSIRKTVHEWRKHVGNITRKLIRKYLLRLYNNRRMIQYGINQLSPDNMALGRISGDAEWTKSFLDGIRHNLSPELNADFHKVTGKSFMSLHNKIA